MVKDTEGNYIAGNDAALAFLECTREEFLAMNVKNTLPPYLDEGWYSNLRSIWETGGTVERDYYVWGKIKVLELTITPLQVGGRKIIFGIGRDVTERKRAETELKLSEEKYRLLAENSLDVIWTAGVDLSPAYISPSIWLHTGYTADEVKHILTHDHGYAATLGMEERDIERKLNAMKALIDGNADVQVIEYQVKGRDGKVSWADEKMSILRDSEGKAVGILGVIRDITVQKKMTENLIIADRLVSLGEMAAGLAHEVNNPLTAVMGFAYLLQQNPDTPPEIKEDVESIYRESKRAAEVIKNFRAFSRGQVPRE
jgi:two-component system NtrC family sensor kinase